MNNKAIFFDKDGVLNKDSGIIWPKVERPYDGVGDIIASFISKGYLIFIITNRTEVARGLATESEIEKYLHDFELQILKQNKHAIISKSYYCPHHLRATVAAYRVNCECRKPKSGLLIKAQEEYRIDLRNSYLVGDRVSDIVAGNRVGLKTILLIGEKSFEAPIVGCYGSENFNPYHKITQLSQLYELI
ncbi:MAG: HAD-IIIA family hydrolase [Oligoflexia bacterium]|nr:HAD-IIIA family hydrolase [Oligoflexia bacterium]